MSTECQDGENERIKDFFSTNGIHKPRGDITMAMPVYGVIELPVLFCNLKQTQKKDAASAMSHMCHCWLASLKLLNPVSSIQPLSESVPPVDILFVV